MFSINGTKNAWIFGRDAFALEYAKAEEQIRALTSEAESEGYRSTIVPLASHGLPVVAIFRSRFLSVARCKSDVLDALVFGFSERKTNCRLVLFLIPSPTLWPSEIHLVA